MCENKKEDEHTFLVKATCLQRKSQLGFIPGWGGSGTWYFNQYGIRAISLKADWQNTSYPSGRADWNVCLLRVNLIIKIHQIKGHKPKGAILDFSAGWGLQKIYFSDGKQWPWALSWVHSKLNWRKTNSTPQQYLFKLWIQIMISRQTLLTRY